MVLKPDQERIRNLLSETITLLCRNGLNFKSEFRVEALIGITLDQSEVFLVSIKETVQSGTPIVAQSAVEVTGHKFDLNKAAAFRTNFDQAAAVLIPAHQASSQSAFYPSVRDYENANGKFSPSYQLPTSRDGRNGSGLSPPQKRRGLDEGGGASSGSRRRQDVNHDGGVRETKRERGKSIKGFGGCEGHQRRLSGGTEKADITDCSTTSLQPNPSILSSNQNHLHSTPPRTDPNPLCIHSPPVASQQRRTARKSRSPAANPDSDLVSVKSEPDSPELPPMLKGLFVGGDYDRWIASLGRSDALVSAARVSALWGGVGGYAGAGGCWGRVSRSAERLGWGVTGGSEFVGKTEHSSEMASSLSANHAPSPGPSPPPDLTLEQRFVAVEILSIAGCFINIGSAKAVQHSLRRLSRRDLTRVLTGMSVAPSSPYCVGVLRTAGASRVFYKAPPTALTPAALAFYRIDVGVYADVYHAPVRVPHSVREPGEWIAALLGRNPYCFAQGGDAATEFMWGGGREGEGSCGLGGKGGKMAMADRRDLSGGGMEVDAMGEGGGGDARGGRRQEIIDSSVAWTRELNLREDDGGLKVCGINLNRAGTGSLEEERGAKWSLDLGGTEVLQRIDGAELGVVEACDLGVSRLDSENKTSMKEAVTKNSDVDGFGETFEFRIEGGKEMHLGLETAGCFSKQEAVKTGDSEDWDKMDDGGELNSGGARSCKKIEDINDRMDFEGGHFSDENAHALGMKNFNSELGNTH